MKIRVNPHNVEIVKEQTEPINELEIKVSKCEFEFDEAITSEFVKEAYFTLNGNTYKMIVENNECDYPNEVLTEKGTLEIGVVAFKVENGEEIVRYNPSPDYFESWVGSLKDAENSEPITPSEMEQFEQELQNGLNQVANVDIDAEKVENVATVTITNRYGEEKSVSIYDGEKGDKGDKGDKGEQGIQGIQGPQGEKGRDGREFHAMVGNTETLPEGSEATVSINEDEENDIVYYNFGIPKGDKGDKGDIGDVDIVTFDVIDGKLIMYSTREHNYTFQLNDNKLEVVYNG